MLRFIAALFFLIFISCDESRYIRKYQLPKIVETQSKTIQKKTNQLKFAWTAPGNWEEGQSSSMRIVSYKVPYTDGFGDLSITHFSGP